MTSPKIAIEPSIVVGHDFSVDLDNIPLMLRKMADWIESGKEPTPRQVILIAVPKKKRKVPYNIYGWGKGVGGRGPGIMGGAKAYADECLWPADYVQCDTHGEHLHTPMNELCEAMIEQGTLDPVMPDPEPLPTAQCTKAPAGWSCRRAVGHDGPCAAEPV